MSLRKLMAAHREKEDLIAIGAYQAGADPVVDEALAKHSAIQGYLQQRVDEPSTIADADHGLLSLASRPVPAAEAAMLLGELPDAHVVPQPAPAPGPVALPPLGLSL
jgi:flagellum-specific ATP synthase